MATLRILSWARNLTIFFLCLSPISCCAGFWDDLFGEDPIEDSESIFDAIEKERAGNVERLLARGNSLEERNSKGLTPLLFAIELLNKWRSDKEKVEKIILILIEKGAFLESSDPQGNTPLLKCCADFLKESTYSLALAKILLERGADLEACNKQGATSLIVAAKNGRADILKILLQKNANKEARNNAHQTALILAAEENRVKAVDELLAAGAFVDSRDENGMTPLMYASYRGHLAIIQILLQSNADIGATLTKNVVIVTKSDQEASYSPFSSPYKNQTVIPVGSTALTFAEKCGGRGAEKILLEAWVKKDPSMERVLIEWRKKATEF